MATPIVALAAVGLGLRVGAASAVRAAVVYGAPSSDAGTGLAWQLVAFDEDRGQREPVALRDVEVIARARSKKWVWKGATNDDGAAEVLLRVPSAEGMSLEIRAGHALLAQGDVMVRAAVPRPPPSSAWARFARREGPVALDVAVLGQRVASGFPATIWVRATDAATRARLAGVTIEAENDGSLSTATVGMKTDARGWARVVATPMGYGVALIVHARAPNASTGLWAGALFVSPGAARLIARDRYNADEEPTLDVVAPNVRDHAYLEIDDAQGRAWAASVPLIATDGEMPSAHVRVPRLAPGLYWAVASSDPAGASRLGPGTIVQPFFVAANDEAALSMATDKEECVPPRDSRETSQVLGVCLALAGATPVPRWIALEGFALHHAGEAQKRATGLGIALGAIAIAILLETILLIRAGHTAQSELRHTRELNAALGTQMERMSKLGISVLVALLGLALLAAFLVRAS
ncbi:MAG: hypothetical protein M3O46_05495 [Myxococcota bacterium]|nr:hypothetical protein [Myxococcota bacterium]